MQARVRDKSGVRRRCRRYGGIRPKLVDGRSGIVEQGGIAKSNGVVALARSRDAQEVYNHSCLWRMWLRKPPRLWFHRDIVSRIRFPLFSHHSPGSCVAGRGLAPRSWDVEVAQGQKYSTSLLTFSIRAPVPGSSSSYSCAVLDVIVLFCA